MACEGTAPQKIANGLVCSDDTVNRKVDAALGYLRQSAFVSFKKALALPLTWALVLSTLALIGLSAWQFASREQIKQGDYRDDIHDIAKQNAAVIRAQLVRSVSATYALGAFIRADNKNVTRDNFNEIADILIQTYGGISNLQFQPFGVVEQVYPAKGSEGAIGHALFVDPKRVESATSTASSKKLTFMGPVKLFQGGVGIIARYPIFTTYSPEFIPPIKSWWPAWNHGCCKDMEMPPGVSFPGPTSTPSAQTYFWGFAGMLTTVENLVAGVNLKGLEGKFEYQLVDLKPADSIHPSGVFVHSPNAPPGQKLQDPVIGTIDYLEAGVKWELRVVPVHGWPALSGDFLIQITLLVVGAFLSVSTRVMNIAVKHTQQSARNELLEAQEHLKQDEKTCESNQQGDASVLVGALSAANESIALEEYDRCPKRTKPPTASKSSV
eukprot:TRINITY_DN57236_c0_g1_i1.p1 TRINITY_DN57236_c0_g1~~TRINITY_DN57236_c0_g1_i1.p1  ORF type:complete len:439 (+),score=67.62 TRINITY_DN57236_c0_g1_i1:65-1381(+)